MTNVEKVKIPEGYKQTEVGVIPEDWDVTTIEKVLSITTGNKNTQDKVVDGLYPFYVRSQTVERINSYSFDGEGVLTAGDGVGTGKIFHYINSKCDIHQRVYLMHKFSDRLHGYYFYIYFKKNFYDKVMSMTAKSSVDSVRREMIADMYIALPAIKEQTAIANALSDVDNLIASLEILIAKKSAIKTAAMQQLLTGNKRLPGFENKGVKESEKQGTKASENKAVTENEQESEKQGRDQLAGSASTTQATQANASEISASLTQSAGQTAPRPGYKQTELGEIPEDWEVDKIENVLSITTGSKNTQDKISDGSYPFYVRSQTVERINSYSFDGEGVLTAGDGVGTGKIFHYINGKCDIHQRVYLMHNFSNRLHGYYFYIYFKTNFYDKVMSMTAKSSVDSVRREMIADMPIILPSKDEQVAVSNVLSDMDTELDALQQRLNKTKTIKQGMMQELLTGKTRLPFVSDAKAST